MIITNISASTITVPLVLDMQILQYVTLTSALTYPISKKTYTTNLATLTALVSSNTITITGNDTNSPYSGPTTITVLAGQTLDLTAGVYAGYPIKITAANISGAGTLFEARYIGNSAGVSSDRAVGGVYLAATDAKCLPCAQGAISGTWDKAYVSSTSTYTVEFIISSI